jgi:hypothetical protein
MMPRLRWSEVDVVAVIDPVLPTSVYVLPVVHRVWFEGVRKINKLKRTQQKILTGPRLTVGEQRAIEAGKRIS